MKHHVLRYHDWMQSDELLEKTASERLTLHEEYEMQQKWCLDEDKCTFIVLAKKPLAETGNEIESMVGDVNLFFNNPDDQTEAEIEVMIADPKFRGCGLGKEAVLSMMFYGYQKLNVKKFTAIIGNSNKQSISLFSKFGFIKVKETAAFNESTFQLEIANDNFIQRCSQTATFTLGKYPIER